MAGSNTIQGLQYLKYATGYEDNLNMRIHIGQCIEVPKGQWRINRTLNSRCFILLSNIELLQKALFKPFLKERRSHPGLSVCMSLYWKLLSCFFWEDMCLVFYEVVMVSRRGLLKYWHKQKCRPLFGWPYVRISWLVFFKRVKGIVQRPPKHGSLRGTKDLCRHTVPSSTSSVAVVEITQGLSSIFFLLHYCHIRWYMGTGHGTPWISQAIPCSWNFACWTHFNFWNYVWRILLARWQVPCMEGVFLFLCLSLVQRFNITSIFSILGSPGMKHILSDTSVQEAILASMRVSTFPMIHIH